MGNDICCIKKRNEDDEDYKYYSRKPDGFLKRKKNESISSRNSNACFIVLYSGSSIATIIIISVGGPATLAISGVLGLGFIIYYTINIRKNIQDISDIEDILDKREKDDIYVYENVIILKK